MRPHSPSASFLFRRGAGLVGCALLFPFLAGCQQDMIYFPSHASEDLLRSQAPQAGLSPWEDDSGQLIGWKSPAGAARPANRLVVFHGNAGMALNRAHYAAGFIAAAPGSWEVFILEYPGYGSRIGRPGEAEFLEAGASALEALWREDARPVFLLGESLGSGVACGLAARFPDRIAGLALVTPFTTLTEVGEHHYPSFLVQLLLKDRYDNQSALEHYRGPVGFLLAGQDEVVPTELGQRLHAGYGGAKRLWIHPTAGHNTLDLGPRAAWWSEMSEFLLSSARPEAGSSRTGIR